ncbi:uncharacterized protein METZ01_LOCUS505376, partial [marine metagenome]
APPCRPTSIQRRCFLNCVVRLIATTRIRVRPHVRILIERFCVRLSSIFPMT